MHYRFAASQECSFCPFVCDSAMLHTENGPKDLNSMFGAMDMPTPWHKTLKRLEREIGTHIKAMAEICLEVRKNRRMYQYPHSTCMTDVHAQH